MTRVTEQPDPPHFKIDAATLSTRAYSQNLQGGKSRL
jgi:hypothetical protein